jgi:hypothetical protein
MGIGAQIARLCAYYLEIREIFIHQEEEDED